MEDFSSQDTRELAKALINVQRDMSPATKDATNPFCKNRYATLNSIMEACRPALLKYGIWLTQLPLPAPSELAQDHIALLTKLTHADTGQWQSSLTIVPLPKSDPQGMGSALTYARRYALTSMLGIVTEDDDGEAARIDANNRQAQVKQKESCKMKQGNSVHNDQSENQEASANRSDLLSHLPQLDGITYQLVPLENGREYVKAMGNTRPKKEILIGAGFRWNAERKFWWKYADAV